MLAPQKESIFSPSCRLWLLSWRRARVFARSCSLLSKYLPISWKQRKEQSHAQCHVTHRIRIWQNFWTCQSCKIGWYCCTRACRYISPRALCITSLSCGEAGIEYIATSWVQSTGVSNWWCCNGPVALSSFADWATMRSCLLPSREPASSRNCWNRASSRARKPVLKNAPWNWSNPRFHTSKKHHFFSTSFLQESE